MTIYSTWRNMRTVVAAVALAAATTACTDNFANINDNPNAPTKGNVELLLNPQLRTLIQAQFNYDAGAALGHQVALTNYNDAEQYNFGTNEGTWSSLYTSMANINDLIATAQDKGMPSSVAIGYVLKAYCAAQLTDHWGNVPYSEAAQGSSNINPTYDKQSDIYLAEGGIVDLLQKAEQMLAEGTDALPSDVVYSGNRQQWRKLANSLRLRYLMRISNRRADISTFNTMLADCLSKPLLDSNDDNFALPFLAGTPNRCPIYEMRSGSFDYYRESKEMADQLNNTNDPRQAVWFQPTAQSVQDGQQAWAGVPNGCSATSLKTIGYNESKVSMLGTLYRNTPDGATATLINAAEVKLLQAEAVARGWAQGNAADLYTQAIKLSMKQYGIGDAAAEQYVQRADVAYNAANGVEQILTQKWLANFMVGYEAWFDFLRTHLPAQAMPMDNRNPSPGQIPSRFYYPETEQAVNKAQLDAALKEQGGKDDINTKLWWE